MNFRKQCSNVTATRCWKKYKSLRPQFLCGLKNWHPPAMITASGKRLRTRPRPSPLSQTDRESARPRYYSIYFIDFCWRGGKLLLFLWVKAGRQLPLRDGKGRARLAAPIHGLRHIQPAPSVSHAGATIGSDQQRFNWQILQVESEANRSF